MYKRIDIEEETNECIEEYETITEVIDDANRYYHEHFTMDDDYNEDFEVKSFKRALDFWRANGYAIINALPNKEQCPLCNSANIKCLGSEIDGGSLSYRYICNDCKATFEGYYELNFKGFCDITNSEGTILPDALLQQHDQVS